MKQLSPKIRLLLISAAAVLTTACLVLLLFFVIRGRTAPEETRFAGEDGFLDGSWRGLRYTGDCRLSVSGTRIRFIGPSVAEGSYRFLPEGLAAGRSAKIYFQGAGPYEYLIYHEQEYEGHTLRLLSCVMMEYDGRGEVITEEYITEEQYSLVPANFASALAERMNGQP